MKVPPLPLIVGILTISLSGLILFSFQVRQTEVAAVTTFGRYSQSITEPGLYPRWFWPIQKVFKYDRRLRSFERKFEQTTTADGRSILVSVFAGWRISDPKLFLERFPGGDITRAELSLESIIRDAKNGTIGRYPFSQIVSTNHSQLQLAQIEQEMLHAAQLHASNHYGISVDLLGVKQLGLPESITAKVFDRMKAERQRLVRQFQSEGEAEAIRIRAQADRQRQEILSRAEADALITRGHAEAAAAQSLAVFEKDPSLAQFLFELNALSTALKDRSTLVLDPASPPFRLLGANAMPQLKVQNPQAPTQP